MAAVAGAGARAGADGMPITDEEEAGGLGLGLGGPGGHAGKTLYRPPQGMIETLNRPLRA